MEIVKFDPNAIAPELLDCAQTCASVQEVLDLVEIDDDLPNLSREQARELMRYAQAESEKDQLAVAPTATSVLSAKVDTALNDYIDHIIEEVRVLTQISRKPKGKVFKIDQSGLVVTPEQASEILSEKSKELIALKKVMAEQTKAESGHGNASSVSLSVDLGSIVTGAIENIKQAEVVVEAKEV